MTNKTEITMRRSILIIFLFSLFYTVSETEVKAQLWRMRRYEATAGIGPSFFFGDVGGFSKGDNILGFKDLSFKQIRYNLNINAKYRISQTVNARISLTYGSLHATDVRGSNEGRAYESSTTIFEPALIGEYFFIKNRSENSYLFTKGRRVGLGRFLRELDFYAFTGIGGLSYTVKGNDALVERGLGSGGFTAVVPIGVGASLIYTPDFNFGIEFGGRYSFSDNLDGYTSQYSRSNDVYYFLNFTFTYKLKTGPHGLPSFR